MLALDMCVSLACASCRHRFVVTGRICVLAEPQVGVVPGVVGVIN